jgi:hypothetical protein
LLIKELGQRGYLKHITLVYPVTQGFNLGESETIADDGTVFSHTCSTYDYRGLVKKLLSLIAEMGIDAVHCFMSGLKAIIRDFEASKIRLWWFWMEIKAALKVKLQAVTTILTRSFNTGFNAASSLARGAHSDEREQICRSDRLRFASPSSISP